MRVKKWSTLDCAHRAKAIQWKNSDTKWAKLHIPGRGNRKKRRRVPVLSPFFQFQRVSIFWNTCIAGLRISGATLFFISLPQPNRVFSGIELTTFLTGGYSTFFRLRRFFKWWQFHIMSELPFRSFNDGSFWFRAGSCPCLPMIPLRQWNWVASWCTLPFRCCVVWRDTTSQSDHSICTGKLRWVPTLGRNCRTVKIMRMPFLATHISSPG